MKINNVMQDYGLCRSSLPLGRVQILLLKQSKVYRHRLTKTGNFLFKTTALRTIRWRLLSLSPWLIFTKLLQKNWNGTLAKFKK